MTSEFKQSSSNFLLKKELLNTMSTKTRSGRSVKPPSKLISVGFNLVFNDGNHTKKPAQKVSWNQELTKVRYYKVDQQDSRPNTRSFIQNLNDDWMLNDNNDNIDPNTEVEGIGKIDNKAVGKQKPKKEKKIFSCTDCGKILGCDRDLTDHRDGVHLGLKNYHCVVPGCQKSYSVDASLKRHEKIDHGQLKPFACPECHIPFPTKNQLKNHKDRAHNGIRRPCIFDGCTKTYYDASNLNRHVKSKHQN